MKKSLVILGVLGSLTACLLWGMCGMTPKTGEGGGKMSGDGYWNSSWVTRDGRTLVAGGDHTAVIELATGKILERLPGMVKAIGAGQRTAVVVGYDVAWEVPGKTKVTQVPAPQGNVVAMTEDGKWVSWTRTVSGRNWRGPASLFVHSPAESRKLELLPGLFGKIGDARSLPSADTFAVRVGGLLDDGRALIAAGWQPAQSGGTVEAVPWGFFAVNLQTGEAAALTLPLPSDAAINQNWVQKIASTDEADFLVVAAHDGKQIAVGSYAQGADRPTRVTALPSAGAASALAISGNGSLIAVGSESRGKDAPATAWVIDQAGKTIWQAAFSKTIVGLHFLDDGSLVVTSAEATAVRVAFPEAREKWRTR